MNDQDLPPGDETSTSDWADQRLDAYLDGELPAEERARFEEHLAESPACREALSRLALAQRALRELPEQRCPERVVAKALDSTKPTVAASRLERPWRRLAVAAAIAACLLLVLSPRPDESPAQADVANATRLDGPAVRRAFGELTTKARVGGASIGERAVRSGFVEPAQRVIVAVRETPLGRWGAGAAALLGPAYRESADES